jgi:hypothetical protein
MFFDSAKVHVAIHVANAVKAARAYDLAKTALELGIAMVIIAVVIGQVALPIFFGVNTSGYDATTKLIWPFLAVLTIVGLLIIILKRAQSSAE